MNTDNDTVIASWFGVALKIEAASIEYSMAGGVVFGKTLAEAIQTAEVDFLRRAPREQGWRDHRVDCHYLLDRTVEKIAAIWQTKQNHAIAAQQ